MVHRVTIAVAEDNSTDDTLTGRRHKSTQQMTQIHKLNWPQIRHLDPDKFVFSFQCSSPPRRLSVRDMFILPPRIGVNIRPAAQHCCFTLSLFHKYSLYAPPSPLEVLEMLMVMGLRYANSELQIQYDAAANTDRGGEQQIRRERTERANNATASESEIMGKKYEER